MLLKANGLGDPGAQQRIREMFAPGGIGPERLEIRGRDILSGEHLARYHQVDIALDTFPYNGTTTTCEALWMGVPVVTMSGQYHISRVGGSLLSAMGLSELIADDVEAYVRIAKELANDLPRLKELRNSMRDRMNRSALRDEKGFARVMEKRFREMWIRWCNG